MEAALPIFVLPRFSISDNPCLADGVTADAGKQRRLVLPASAEAADVTEDMPRLLVPQRLGPPLGPLVDGTSLFQAFTSGIRERGVYGVDRTWNKAR